MSSEEKIAHPHPEPPYRKDKVSGRRIYNLCPHDIHVMIGGGEEEESVCTIPASGIVTRIRNDPPMVMRPMRLEGDNEDVVPVCETRTFTDEIENWPVEGGKFSLKGADGKESTMDVPTVMVGQDFVVSSFTAEKIVDLASKGMPMPHGNVYAVDMSPDSAVRNEKGEISGTRRLMLVASRYGCDVIVQAYYARTQGGFFTRMLGWMRR